MDDDPIVTDLSTRGGNDADFSARDGAADSSNHALGHEFQGDQRNGERRKIILSAIWSYRLTL